MYFKKVDYSRYSCHFDFRTGVPFDHQLLEFEGRRLEDHESLLHYGIKEQSMLYMGKTCH